MERLDSMAAVFVYYLEENNVDAIRGMYMNMVVATDQPTTFSAAGHALCNYTLQHSENDAVRELRKTAMENARKYWF